MKGEGGTREKLEGLARGYRGVQDKQTKSDWEIVRREVRSRG